MRFYTLFIFIGILGIFSACQKVEDPQLEPIHRYTYYVRTNGNNVLLIYLDNNGKEHKEIISNISWHKTYEAEVGTKVSIKVLPGEDCYIECYYAQDGKKIMVEPWHLWYAYHGVKCEYVVLENVY